MKLKLLDRTLDKLELKRVGSWPETVHLCDEANVLAINAALTAQRPLLVRGEPGIGKSQLARAAAQALDRLFVWEVVHARTESQDLQWHFDAVGRLGEAQAIGSTRAQAPEQIKNQLALRKFLCPAALWWVFDWESAEEQYKGLDEGRRVRRPVPPEDWDPTMGSVLLIDEIDKAEADLPNGLLETLGNGAFTVPYLDKTVGLPESIPAPLVIITTNEERQLPSAFVRRCLVLHLRLPEDQEAQLNWLLRRAEAHFGKYCSLTVRQKAAEQLLDERNQAISEGLPRPGQAEYLDLLRALTGLTAEKDDRLALTGFESVEDAQLALLEKIKDFALKKVSLEF